MLAAAAVPNRRKIDEMGALSFLLDITEVNGEAERRHEQELDNAQHAGEHDGGHEIETGATPDLGETRPGRAPPFVKPSFRLGATSRARRNHPLACCNSVTHT